MVDQRSSAVESMFSTSKSRHTQKVPWDPSCLPQELNLCCSRGLLGFVRTHDPYFPFLVQGLAPRLR